MTKNSKGKVYYGMHFYPGVAEYSEAGKEPYRIFLNEDTIRSMDPTFAGRPIFVEHVDEVEESVDDLRKEADGWVIESFFNAADGKHWVKFIVVSEKGERAIQSGFRLSNAYIPKSFGPAGQWNGVSYAKEVLSGEFEHLAIVNSPRYEESEIMTPEQFKKHNSDKQIELTRLANSKDQTKEKEKMKFNLFKRSKTKLENALDSDTVIEIQQGLKDTKGKEITKEVSFETLVNSYTAIHNMHGYANGDHMVKIGEDEMSVNDLVKKHMEMCNSEKERLEKENSDDGMDASDADMENAEDESTTVEEGEKDVGDRGGEKDVENAEGEEKSEKKMNAAEKAKADKIAAKKKADAIQNAHLQQFREEPTILELTSDKVERGKQRYGARH